MGGESIYIYDPSADLGAVSHTTRHTSENHRYNEVRILPEDEKYTAFAIPFGTFQTRVMKQGDWNAPATMMKLMYSIFQDMLGIKVFIYLDDILIFSKTIEDHIETIRETYQRLRKHKLYAN